MKAMLEKHVSHKVILHLILLMGMGALAFCNALEGPFCLDDIYQIKNNVEIQSIWPVSRFFLDAGTGSSLEHITQYRPMMPLSLALTYAISGDSLIGFHTGNLVCHLGSVILIYFLFLELLHYSGREDDHHWTALLGALIFAVHPVSGFTITYLSLRDLQLMTLFLYASLLLYLRGRRIGLGAGRWSLLLILFILSLFSKTNAVVLPGLVFLAEVFLLHQKLTSGKLWLKITPFFLAIGFWFTFTHYVVGFSDVTNAVEMNSSAYSYALTQLKIHTFEYLRNFFWPFYIRLMPAEEAYTLNDPSVLAGLLIISVPLCYVGLKRKTFPLLAFLTAAYWMTLLPTSSFIPLFYRIAHYRPYPALPFLILLLLLIIQRVCSSKHASTIGVLGILYFTLTSLHLNGYWKSNERLWKRSVTLGGGYVAHLNYAMAIEDRFDPLVKKHLEEAIRLSPDAVVPRLNLGLLLIDYGDYEAGLALVKQGVARGKHWGQSYFWLSHAYEKGGDRAKALDAALRAATLSERRIDYHYRAALLLQYFGRYQESLQYLEKIQSMNATYADTLFMKAFAFQKLGKLEDAEESYRSFIAMRPEHVQAYLNLALLLKNTHRCEEALSFFQAALLLAPDLNQEQYQLDRCSSMQKDAHQENGTGTQQQDTKELHNIE